MATPPIAEGIGPPTAKWAITATSAAASPASEIAPVAANLAKSGF